MIGVHPKKVAVAPGHATPRGKLAFVACASSIASVYGRSRSGEWGISVTAIARMSEPNFKAFRETRSLAHGLPTYEVVGTDIDPGWNRLYRFVSFWKYHKLKNYRFVRESIFELERGDTRQQSSSLTPVVP